VASPGFAAKLRENHLRVTRKKYYAIHAINSEKAICQYIFFWVGNHTESNARVYAALVTRKIKELKVEGHVPQCPIAGDANATL